MKSPPSGISHRLKWFALSCPAAIGLRRVALLKVFENEQFAEP
jgi:hypothetical protein